MKPVVLKDLNKTDVLYIFYDFEATQEKGIQDDETTKIHVPNFCATGTVCTNCIDRYSEIEGCRKCDAKKRKIFKTNVVGDFVDYVLQASKKFKSVRCIAHNSYDLQFILQYLIHEKKYDPPGLVMSGTKIMCLTLKHFKFIDSLNFFHMPLAALPKAFGLDNIV